MIGRIVIALFAMLLWVAHAPAAEVRESTDAYGPFGTLHIYQTSDKPTHLVLFISGDGGWNLGVVDMARSLATLDSMVVGININHYIPPVLVGYSSGATMVYATLAQSPSNTFAGGISMGFSPDLKTRKPFCRGSGMLSNRPDPKLGYIYTAVDRLPSPWKVLQGDIDKDCPPLEAKNFVAKVGGAALIALPKVGHGFSVQRHWMPQFINAFHSIVSAQVARAAPLIKDADVKGLPLVVLPAAGKSNSMAVIISGDGGWASLDKQIGETLNKEGIPVIGFNSLQYFWEEKTPAIAGKDLARILAHYSRAWSINRFILVGYSRGADTLPFMVSRLPVELKSKA